MMNNDELLVQYLPYNKSHHFIDVSGLSIRSVYVFDCTFQKLVGPTILPGRDDSIQPHANHDSVVASSLTFSVPN